MGSEMGPMSDLLLACAAGCAALLTLGVVLVFRDGFRSVLSALQSIFGGGLRSSALCAAEELSGAVASLRQKVEMLDEFASEYHNAFHAAGWADVVAVFNDLVAAEQIVEMMIKNRRFKDAFTLSVFLLGELPEDLVQATAERFEDFAHLLGWQERTRDTLKVVIDNANRAAEMNARAGVSRAGGRRRTLDTLAELRRELD